MTPDYLLDRSKLRNEVLKWKRIVFLIALLAITMLTIGGGLDAKSKPNMGGSYIARVKIEGIILHDTYSITSLKNLADDKNAKAVILYINSPGGSVVGGESLYNAIRKISAKKPVVTVMGDTAASAAYMTAIASDYLIAHQGTITGSIGVLLESFEFTELAQKIGIKFNTFKSSPLKAAPLPTEQLTPDVKAALNATLKDVYEMFFEMVLERRKIPEEHLRVIADGRIYTGRQALANGLIDAIGDEDTALAWLKNARQIDTALKTFDYSIVEKVSSLDRFLDSMADSSVLLKNYFKNGLFSFL